MLRLKANKTSLYSLVASFTQLPGMRRVDFQKASGRPNYWLEWTTDDGHTKAFLSSTMGHPVLTITTHDAAGGQLYHEAHRLSVDGLRERGMVEEVTTAKGPFWVRYYRGVRMSKKATDETLGREAVKEYLQQYHTAVGKKRILEERHRVLSSELRAPSTGSAFRLTPPTKPTKTDGSVSVVFRISEVEDRIEEQREEMAKAVLNVMNLIDVLPANSTERTVVEMRHIDCRGWDKIAEALYMSRSNVFNYYNAALDKILENKRNRKLLEEYMARKQRRAGPHGRNNRP